MTWEQLHPAIEQYAIRQGYEARLGTITKTNQVVRLTVITNSEVVIELPISAEGTIRYPIHPTATISMPAKVTNRVWNLGQ